MKNKESKHLSRRNFLKAATTTGVSASVATSGALISGCASESQSGLSFSEIPHGLDHNHHVAPGYSAKPLLSWGDHLTRKTDFKPENLNAAEQAVRFGYNNDFIAFMPLSDDTNASREEQYQSNNSRRGLLCVNHEYTQPHLMFGGYTSEEEAEQNTLLEHLHTELMACGHSVVEVFFDDDSWQVNHSSPYNRRITLATPINIEGPAAGNPRLATSVNPEADRVLGTVGNCAGGKTPWGTVLIAEEGFAGVFSGDLDQISETEQDNYRRLAIGEDDARPWGKADPRFDINQELNEANRFGWMVELDPYDPTSTPRKLTSLGRFEHEGTTIVTKPGEPLVAYTGDDDEFQFFYKFVSNGVYDPDAGESNRDLLTKGTLYAAKLNDDGSGQWLPLTHGQPFLTEKFGFSSQADVMIECRRAAKLIGATPMDRPEDIETNPVNDCTYVMLTKNRKRKVQDPGNLRKKNTAGHILEIIHPGREGHRDHSSESFQWVTFLLGGHPRSSSLNDQGFYGTSPSGTSVSESGWFVTPDNLTFDQFGNMWVATDGCEDFHFHDGLWAMPTAGPYRAIPKHFFGCPQGAELCGPEFTPDGTTLFVAIQHPADAEGSLYDNPSHRWPDFNENLPPRPTVLAIRKDDGGIVGS